MRVGIRTGKRFGIAQGTELRAQGAEHRAQGAGHRAQGAGHRAQGKEWHAECGFALEGFPPPEGFGVGSDT